MQARTRAILIVDDEEAIRDALQTLLETAGYAVSVARTGRAALKQLTDQPCDLVLLDVLLPEMDGLEVCRRIRQAPHYVPIIMLTARDELSDRLVGLELGADLYLTKPFEPRELLAHVKAMFRLLEHGPGFAQTREDLPVVCGPLALWHSRRRAELSGTLLELTPTEYELLRTLLEQPGRVLGRETLLRKVWGYDYAGDTRTVDVHVQRLRAKIETDPARPRLLLTVRGFGYRLATPAELEEQG